MGDFRILAVHNFYKIPGGEDSVFANECKLLKCNGNDVTLYTRHNKELKGTDLFFTAPFSKKTYRDVRKLIQSHNINIVHVHNDRFLISPSVFKAASDEGVPVVQTLHNFRLLCINAMLTREGKVCRECLKDNKVIFAPAIHHKCYRNNILLTELALRINKNAYRNGLYDKAFFIALTDFNREIFSKSGINGDRIFVKPNFTFSAFNDADRAGERRDFIYLGRLDPLKGIEDILEEWKRVPEDIVLNVAGSGEEGYMNNLKARYSMANVRFLGALSHEDAMEKLRTSRAMVFASRWYEGFPMTIIESFLNGTPVIGKNFGNGGDIIKKIYGSEEPLINDISELHNRVINFDRDSADGLYRYGKETLNDFTPDRNYEILMGIYNKILSER
ncbi:MAG: glycosyltransferase family 4 protein [Lachnospiraceae bacterium]|nr:glycosyltransferase family 4 protein [Lachnospiraceae bacterium]